jgi:hypothetical protein
MQPDKHCDERDADPPIEPAHDRDAHCAKARGFDEWGSSPR